MRFLFLSNYYPPHNLGGYEQWCQEVAIALVQRGHTVHVLTACVAGEAAVSQEQGVTIHRQLNLEVTGGLGETIQRLLYSQPKLEAATLQATHNLIAQTKPNVALLWGMWNVPRRVPALVETLMPGRVAYYLCDYWLTLPSAYVQRWQEPAHSRFRPLQWAKQRLGDYFLARLAKETAVSLRLDHPICVSQAVRDLLVEQGVAISHSQIIYGGTQVEQFLTAATRAKRPSDHTLRLLYIGRLVAEKGVHDILAALREWDDEKTAVTLDIYGQGDPDYTTSLRAFIQQHRLEKRVIFHDSVPRAAIPDILAQYDALIFPSIWPEPFARAVLEAMAAGLVVIGTTTGGTGEILIEGKTGLTYPAGNAQALARQIARLAENTSWRAQLAKTGQELVMKEFTFERMVNELEAALTAVSHTPSSEVAS